MQRYVATDIDVATDMSIAAGNNVADSRYLSN
jgi:hypothetical protein